MELVCEGRRQAGREGAVGGKWEQLLVDVLGLGCPRTLQVELSAEERGRGGVHTVNDAGVSVWGVKGGREGWGPEDWQHSLDRQ